MAARAASISDLQPPIPLRCGPAGVAALSLLPGQTLAQLSGGPPWEARHVHPDLGDQILHRPLLTPGIVWTRATNGAKGARWLSISALSVAMVSSR